MAQIVFLSLSDVIEKRYLNWRALCIFSHLIKNFLVKMIYSLAIPVLIALFNSAHCARNSPPSTSLRQRSDFSIIFFDLVDSDLSLEWGWDNNYCAVTLEKTELTYKTTTSSSNNFKTILSESGYHFVKILSFSKVNTLVITVSAWLGTHNLSQVSQSNS